MDVPKALSWLLQSLYVSSQGRPDLVSLRAIDEIFYEFSRTCVDAL